MEMLILLTVTDEEVFESFEIYLTRFKAKELELTILFTKALKFVSRLYCLPQRLLLMKVIFDVEACLPLRISTVRNCLCPSKLGPVSPDSILPTLTID